MTINPQKVSNELKPKIIQYQTECDEVLWNHWNGKTKTTQQPALPTPEKSKLPALSNNKKRHYWLTVDANGMVVAQVPLVNADDLRGQVEKYLPCHAVMARQAIIEDMDAVIYAQMEAQNTIRLRMNRLISYLGETNESFWADRVTLAGEKHQQATG